MELDKTAIALRQRSFTDTIDLSLTVVRIHWLSLLGWSALGIVPFAIVNAICLNHMTGFDSMNVYGYTILSPEALRIRYGVWMSALVFLEAPIAMLGVTFYLGQSVFFSHPAVKDFVQSLRQSFWGVVWVLGFLRMGLFGLLVPFLVWDSNRIDLGFEFFVYGVVLVGIIVIVRSVRTFIPEILILEGAPLRTKSNGKSPSVDSVRKRSRWLHRQFAGELFRRFIATSIVSMFLLGSLSMGWLFMAGIFFNAPTWDWWMDHYLFPCTLWIVAIWATVIRFLSYLDTRTRLEGWELELRLKAEGARIREAIQ